MLRVNRPTAVEGLSTELPLFAAADKLHKQRTEGYRPGRWLIAMAAVAVAIPALYFSTIVNDYSTDQPALQLESVTAAEEQDVAQQGSIETPASSVQTNQQQPVSNTEDVVSSTTVAANIQPVETIQKYD